MTEVSIISKPVINLLCKQLDWFLYDRDLRQERVKDSCIEHSQSWWCSIFFTKILGKHGKLGCKMGHLYNLYYFSEIPIDNILKFDGILSIASMLRKSEANLSKNALLSALICSHFLFSCIFVIILSHNRAGKERFV